jgi:hypothetical protein
LSKKLINGLPITFRLKKHEMSKQKNIKQTYADALFWAMSPKSKGKPYRITRTQESILRKLIHYDSSNPQITYSNEIIGQHTFNKSTTIEKVIPALTKKKYIKTITFQINDGSGQITSRRTININWDFINKVLSEVPVATFSEPKEDFEPNKTEANVDTISQPNTPPTVLSPPTFYKTLDEDEFTFGYKPIPSNSKPKETKVLEPKLVDGILNVHSDLINFSIVMREKIHNQLEKQSSVNYLKGLICFDDGTSYASELLKINDNSNTKAIYMTRNYIETGVPK